MGVSRDCANFFGYPLLSQQLVKLRTSNFVGTFIGSTGTKAYENIGNRPSGRGRSQRVPKIFRAPICRENCAVIFAIAQLSCFTARPSSVHNHLLFHLHPFHYPLLLHCFIRIKKLTYFTKIFSTLDCFCADRIDFT